MIKVAEYLKQVQTSTPNKNYSIVDSIALRRMGISTVSRAAQEMQRLQNTHPHTVPMLLSWIMTVIDQSYESYYLLDLRWA